MVVVGSKHLEVLSIIADTILHNLDTLVQTISLLVCIQMGWYQQANWKFNGYSFVVDSYKDIEGGLLL